MKKHKFVKVEPSPISFACLCISCGRILETQKTKIILIDYSGRTDPIEIDNPIWADQYGKPFKAYYCNECKTKTEEQNNEQNKDM